MITVLLADDHETVRQGLRLLIEAQPDMEVVGEAGDGRSAVTQAMALQPSVIVLDISMPEQNGVSAAREIAAGSSAAIVVLTRHRDPPYVQAVLSAGAAAYVLKQSPSAELVAAIRATAAGRKYLDSALADQLAGAFGRRSGALETRGRATEREGEVLRLIARGFSNKEIAAQLELSVKTVEVHKANVMRKLRLASRVDVMRYAVQQGWLYE